MQWDLGLQGLGLLDRDVARLRRPRSADRGTGITRWLWLIASAAAFVGGLLTSEVWFGWATEEELQPNIDGLSFDEAMLAGLLSAIVAMLVTRYVIRKRKVGPDDRAECEGRESKPHALSGTGA